MGEASPANGLKQAKSFKTPGAGGLTPGSLSKAGSSGNLTQNEIYHPHAPHSNFYPSNAPKGTHK